MIPEIYMLLGSRHQFRVLSLISDKLSIRS
jgi:hypothetical protein